MIKLILKKRYQKVSELAKNTDILWRITLFQCKQKPKKGYTSERGGPEMPVLIDTIDTFLHLSL